MFTIRKRQCERFEPRSHFKSKTLKMTTAQIVETSVTVRTTFSRTIKLNLLS